MPGEIDESEVSFSLALDVIRKTFGLSGVLYS